VIDQRGDSGIEKDGLEVVIITGEDEFSCQMGMLRGELIVE
jgi:hypothetical protein